MHQETLRLTVFGGCEVMVGETAVTNLASRKAEALLVYLACQPGPHPRETVATLLWDDRTSNRALGNLSVLLSSMRKQGLDPYLLTNRQEVGIDETAAVWLDATELERQHTAVQRHLTIHQTLTRTLAKKLAQTIDLVQGEFLAGFHLRDASGFDEWVLFQRERSQRQAITALEHLIDFYEQRQNPGPGIPYAYRLVSLDPLRESGYRRLMRLLAQDGQRTAALEQYELCATRLDEELGVEPDPRTTAVYEQIRDQPRTILPLEKPPHQPVARQTNLPAQTTPLIGRDAELADIIERLNTPACRLLSLIGPGGVGKTQLALTAGRQLLPDFFDGVWFIPLAAALPDFIETAVADPLGFNFSANRDDRQQLLDYLRPKELLLILDNLEHLLDDHSVGFIQQLLTHAPEIKLLLTSRERLQVRDEWLIELHGLPYPPQPESTMERWPAVQLFQQRATQLVGPLPDDSETQTAVYHICHAVMGLPLGLELAAAATRYYSCAHIAQALDENLDFLATTQRDVPVRHRSLRAVFDYSWRLMSPAEQETFAQLSVLRGQFDQSAAVAVSQASTAALHQLVDKSMVTVMANGRFQMHELIRQYASSRLAAQPTWEMAARRRHAIHFVNFLRHHLPHLRGGEQQAALEAVQREMENARVGWQYAQTLPPSPEMSERLGEAADALFYYFTIRSLFREGVTLFETAVESLTTTKTEFSRLGYQLQARIGWLRFLLGDENGRLRLSDCLSAAEAAHDTPEIIFCLNYLGAIANSQQAYETAVGHLTRSIQLCQETDSPFNESIALNILGVCNMKQKRYEQAARYLTASLQHKRRLGDRWGMAFSLENLGELDLELGRLAPARQQIEESMSLRRHLGDQRGMALGLQRLGRLAIAEDNPALARQHFSDCYQIFDEIGDAQGAETARQYLLTLAATA